MLLIKVVLISLQKYQLLQSYRHLNFSLICQSQTVSWNCQRKDHCEMWREHFSLLWDFTCVWILSERARFPVLTHFQDISAGTLHKIQRIVFCPCPCHRNAGKYAIYNT